MTDTAHQNELLTLKQVQVNYGRAYSWWWRRVCTVIPAQRYGAGWVVRRGDVEAYLASLTPTQQ